MKYFELDKEEIAIDSDLDAGKLRRVKNFVKLKSAIEGYAQNDLKKTRSINVRLSEGDLLKLKAMALEEGIPYQTYFTPIVHKFLRKEVA